MASNITFPNESAEYRAARNELLESEIALREQVEKLGALRRQLPLGGAVKEDYVFDELADGEVRQVRLSELFADDKEALFAYGFMYGPEMADACPMCSSFLDALDGNAPQLLHRINLAVIARSPIHRIAEFAEQRGWRHLRLLSSAGNDYPRDYWVESSDGGQMPMANVFVRRDGEVRHFWGSEMLYAGLEGDPRHMDLMWPLWNVLDAVPEGRGATWYPPLWPKE